MFINTTGIGLFVSTALIIAAAVPQVLGATGQEWKVENGFRSLEIASSGFGRSSAEGFSLIPLSETGISFTNALSEQRHLANQILLNGSGVAAGDMDGDGWTDLYFCGLDGPNALYRNLGNWKFEEIALEAGAACPELMATGAAFADLEGDGDLDLIVNSVGQGTQIFLNNGRGHFNKAPLPLNGGRGGMSLALGDLDGDGFLDLYIANYRTLGLMDIPNARATFKTVNGRSFVETFNGWPTKSPELTNRFGVGSLGGIEEYGEADQILRSNGGTNFTPFPLHQFQNEAGETLASPFYDWGLAVAFRDVNGDLLPDIYVCNDFQTEDRLWMNQGNGVFRLAPRIALRKTSMFSMAVDFADVNRDGRDDFFLADMMSRDHSQRMRDMGDHPPPARIGEIENRPQYSLNTLFLGRGDHTFAEVAQLSGVEASEWSWSCVFVDVDLDGWEDILVSNGMERAARDLDVAEKLKGMRAMRRMSDAEIFRARKAFPRLATRNLAFRNKRDLTFEEASEKWSFNLPGVSHGIALADLDNDGDLDVAVNNLNAPAAIYRNESTAGRVAIRLKGLAPNTRGIGARIRVLADGLPIQSQEMMAGGRYLSSDDPVRTFATGSSGSVSVEVLWRDGKITKLSGLPPNRIYEIDETTAKPNAPTEPANMTPLFADVSDLLRFTHQEEAFDDFARQPLLPRKLSQNGPAAAWVDVNRDGWDDLALGAAKNQTIAYFQNSQKGSFERVIQAPFHASLKREVSGVTAARVRDDELSLILGMSNFEDGLGYGAAIVSLQRNDPLVVEISGAWESTTGPLALGDMDQDGDLDLFAGGGSVPGRYPAAASSRIFRNDNGKFVLDAANQRTLTNLALVNGAIFFDVDDDTDTDLLLVCEWNSIRLLLNSGGVFSDASEQFGFGKYKGLWNGIAAGDFDEDGRLDFVASNWGRNSKYEPFRDRPIKLIFGDFDEDGTFDIVESHYDPALRKEVPYRQRTVLGASLPFVNDRFRSHAAYSNAGVEEILGDFFARSQVVEAGWLETTVFLNRGNRFEAKALPVEAQFSPAFGVCVADFDGDSHDDIVLAQNFFAVQPETPRYDAGRSLLLKGDGRGGFRAVDGQESGLLVYGEQRSVASGDFDQDGRSDLVITQNGAEAKLYRNTKAEPGIRIILDGPPKNRDAVGTSFRVIAGGKAGPRKLISAGSGYQSQNSFVQIIAKPKAAAKLEVSWPDGQKTTVELPAGSSELRIRHPDVAAK